MPAANRFSAWIAGAVTVLLIAGPFHVISWHNAPAVEASVATGFADTFDRPDTTMPGNGWFEAQGDLIVQSHQLRNAPGLPGLSIAVQPAFVSDQQTASATFASASNNSIPVLGLVLRYESPQRYYALYRMAGGTSVLRISAITNGQEIVLAQAGISNPSEMSPFGSLLLHWGARSP